MIIAFRCKSSTKPILQITDNGRGQVVIRFLPFRDEHLTLHLENNGQILRTHYSENKSASVWDDTKVDVAKALGYKNPERHGKYIIHTPLVKIDNLPGYHLVGRRIELDNFTPRARYVRSIDKTFEAPASKFMLIIFLSTDENPCPPKFPKVPVSLGDVCFDFS